LQVAAVRLVFSQGGEIMKNLLIVFALGIAALFTADAWARSSYQSDAELSSSARSAFEEILDLWRAGSYEGLYDRTRLSDKMAREDFVAKLENASYKPACCWQKLQDVTVHIENDDMAVIRAKVGLEGSTGIKYKTRSYRLIRERDLWRISQADIFSLAGAKKAKKGSRKHR
jgi:hypothetical protein